VKAIVPALALALLLTTTASAAALDSASWWTVDAGGAYETAGAYQIGATAGQPDAATVSAGWYQLRGGYWPGAIVRHVAAIVPIGIGSVTIQRRFTWGQLSIVASIVGLIAVWLRRGRRVTA